MEDAGSFEEMIETLVKEGYIKRATLMGLLCLSKQFLKLKSLTGLNGDNRNFFG